MEHSCYTQVCKFAKDDLPQDVTLDRHAGCSLARKAHCSFNITQQVCYPSDPLQPGLIYFKCPQKCSLFGVACKYFTIQMNFLLTSMRASTPGMGPTLWCQSCTTSLTSTVVASVMSTYARTTVAVRIRTCA